MQFVNYTTVFNEHIFLACVSNCFVTKGQIFELFKTEQIMQVDEGTYIFNKTISLLMWPYLSTVTFF